MHVQVWSASTATSTYNNAGSKKFPVLNPGFFNRIGISLTFVYNVNVV
jgi:hypothetical protein